MRKYRSLHNLNDQSQKIQHHIMLPNLNSEQLKQVHVHHLLSPEPASTQLPQMKVRKNKSLSQLEQSILKIHVQNAKLKTHLLAIKKQRKAQDVNREMAENANQMFGQFRNRLSTEQKDFYQNRTLLKNQPEVNRRHHSEGKYQDRIEQKQEIKTKRVKSFNKCRARPVERAAKAPEDQKKSQNKKISQSSSVQKPASELKLNLRKQLNMLKIPDNKKPLKLTNPSQFRSAIPKDGGYRYIQSPFDRYNSGKEMETKVETTVSRLGVMVKEWEETHFYSNQEHESYLKKIERLSQIQFYRKFLEIKTFKRWKIRVFSQRFLMTRERINERLPNLYPMELLQIRKIFDNITNYRYIKLSRESPLEYEKYLMFLHDSSYPVLKQVTEQHYMQLMGLILGPIREKVVAMGALGEKHHQLIEKHKKPYKLSKRANFLHLTSLATEQLQSFDVINNFQRTYQFKNEFLHIEGFIKRIFYSFNSCHIEWTQSIYREIITKLRGPLGNYKKVRQKIHCNLNNLFNLKNQEEYRYEKTDSYEMQIRLIEYRCEFLEGKRVDNGEGMGKKEQRLFTSLRQEEILGLFEQFATHLISRLSPTNILTYYKNHCIVQHRMGKAESTLPAQQQLQVQILQMVMQKIDIYTSSNIINSSPEMKYDEKFHEQLEHIIFSNIDEANQIVDILNTLIVDMMDFFHSQNRKQSYILSYTIMEETREKIALIPDDIQVGLFVIDILDVKNYLKDFINHQLQDLTKDLPDQFRSTYSAFHQKLLNYTNKINLSVWTVEDFVTSFQQKEMYEEYREEQIYKDQQKIKNILSAVNKTLPKTYEQCYVLFLKLKDMIQKIETKVQTFDLNCIKKLKFFGNEIENLAETIWRELVRVRGKILEVDNFVERETFIEDILFELPKFEGDLNKIKKSIERLSYIQTLQIRFSLKEKLTEDFNLYQKSQSDLKLLQSLLRKLLIFQKSYAIQLHQSITIVNAQSLLQEIHTNKSQIKISQRYIISYQKILMKIYDLYDYYKMVLETADQLGRLEKDDICQIIRLVMVENANKEEGAVANKLREKSMMASGVHNTKEFTFAPKEQPATSKQQTATPVSALNQSQLYHVLNFLSNLLKKDNILTLQQTINFKLYKKYDQIHYEILKKQKKKKMELIIKNIETNMNDIILEVCNLEKSPFGNTEDHLPSVMLIGGKYESKQSIEIDGKKAFVTNRMNSILPEDAGEHTVTSQTKQKQEINLHSGFVNLKQSIKVIEQILNELKNIILSPFLEDQKHILLQKIQYVASNLDILNLLLSAQTKVQKLIQDNILTEAMKQIEKDWTSHHNQFESKWGRGSKEISFDNKLEKDVINAWYHMLRRLSNKKVSQISLCFREQSNDLQNFMARLNSLEKIVNIKIQEKKTIFPLLYFYTNSQILKFVLSPQTFVSHMFPCQKFQCRDKKRYSLTTIYGQEIEMELQQQPSLTIKSIYEEVKSVIGEMFQENLGQYPMELLAHYSKERTPLQILYVLDQLYLQGKYSTGVSIVGSCSNREQTVTSLMGEVKVLSRTMDDPVESQAFEYKNMLAEMLICCRIDYRNRLEVNFVENYWLQELLVYYLDSYNTLYFKNLSHQLEVKYFLVNATNLISLFPGSQRTFVKMCEAFSGQISAIHVQEPQMLKSLAAKLMYPFIVYDFQNKVPEDLCRGVVWNYPLFFVARFDSIAHEVLSKLIRCIEKVRHELLKERQQKGASQLTYMDNAYFANSSDSACIFLMIDKSPQKQPIPYKLKATFRSLTRITPSYELVFLSKLLRADLDSYCPEILDCLYIVNGYFYLYRQILGHNPCFSFVNKLLSKLAKQLASKKVGQYLEVVQEFLVEYFANLGLDKNSIENFLPKTKSLEQFKAGTNSRENRANKNHNKKFLFVYKFLIDAQKEQPQVISSFSTGGYSDVSKSWTSTYDIKQKIDSFIEGVRDNSHGCIPDTILTMLQDITRIVTGSMNKGQRAKPVFIFGEHRTGKTVLVKLLMQFLNKVLKNDDVNVEILHESEIPKNYARVNEMQKRIAILKLILEGKILQRVNNSFVFLQVSSSSNQNGFLQTFLSMFEEQNSSVDVGRQMRSLQKSKQCQTMYFLQIKKMVTISPNIFLNTCKFYLPQKLSLVENITKKWSWDFMNRYDIKEKDELYNMVVNAHHVGFRLVMGVVDSLNYVSGSGVDWLLQPVLENVITTVLKLMSAFLMEVTDVEVLFKSVQGEVGTARSLTHPSTTALPSPNQELSKQKQQQFLKMVAYCTFWALAFYSQQSSCTQIQKVVKEHYYRLTAQTIRTKDNFLLKILLIENNHISYNFMKCLNGEFDSGEEMSLKYSGMQGALIVENLNMKVFNMFCGKLQQLGFRDKSGNNILVIGREEVGKSTYLKNYLNSNSDNVYIRVRSHDVQAMDKFLKQLTQLQYRKPKGHQGKEADSIGTKRSFKGGQANKQSVLVWVENVAFYQETSEIEKYMKFLSEYKQYRCRSQENEAFFVNKQLSNLMYFTERRYAEKEFLYENWNLTVMSVSFLQQELDTIFAHVITQKLANYICNSSILEQLKAKLPITANHHLTLLKFCRQNTKPSLNNWTIDIGYRKYRHVTEEFFSEKNYSFLSGLNAQEIIKRLNLNLFFTLFCCMQNKKDLEMFENRVSKFLDLQYKEVEGYLMDQESEINNAKTTRTSNGRTNINQIAIHESNNSLAKLSLRLKENRFFKKVLIHPTFCRNFQIVSFALRNKKHLMINKIFISRDFSFIEMVLEIQGRDWGKLDLVKSYEELKESISKLGENVVVTEEQEESKKVSSAEKKAGRQNTAICKKEFYLYVPYEIVKLNPLILDYIVEYIEERKQLQQEERQLLLNQQTSARYKKKTKQQKAQQQMLRGLIASSSVVFVVEYSLFELGLINNYLLTQLPKLCTVLRLLSPGLVELEDVGLDILAKKFADQQAETLKQIAKTLHTVLCEIYAMPLNDISYKKTKFVQEYNFHIRNYGQFVRIVGEVYFQRLRFAELKKNSLELTLSQIDKLVREYRYLKKEEGLCLSSKKTVMVSIETATSWLKSAKKKVDSMRVYSVEQGIYKYKQNIQSISEEITKITENQRRLAKMSRHLISLISRNQLAELKYIFVNNFTSMKVLFECICLVLGDGTDFAAMKKCFTDFNLVNRLKDVELEKIKFETMLQIKEKINQVTAESKSFSTVSNKTVFEWLRCSVDLIITRNEMENKLPKLYRDKEELEVELHRLIETNEINSLQQEIQEKQTQLVKDKQSLKQVEEKLSGITELVMDLQKFDEFFQLRKNCEEQSKALSQSVKDFLYYSIVEGVELIYFNIYSEQEKKKFRSNFANFMKRKFGFISSREKQETFDKFEEGHATYSDTASSDSSPILELKYNYSMEITKILQYVNKLLTKNQETLMIIDPYNSFINAIKMRPDILIVGLRKFMKNKFNYGEYRVLIVELEEDEWNVSLKELAKNSKNQRKILEYQKKRIMLPSELHVIFIKKSICSSLMLGQRQYSQNSSQSLADTSTKQSTLTETTSKSSSPISRPQPFTELMFAFRIINFEISQSDYYLLIKMITIEQLIKAKEHSSLEMIINKQEIIRKSFMGVLYFFCKKTNQFAIKNVKLIRQAISIIEMWKITMIETRGFQYEVFEEKHQKQQIKKIYRILSKMFKLVETYFSRDNHYLHFDYFLTTLTRGAIYGIYNFGDEKYFILQYVISMIVYSLDSKNEFLSMFFMKIYSIEENICTQMESDNLTFVMSEFDQLEGFVVEKIQKGTYNYFKHLPFQNKYLQNCYTKILGAQKIANNLLSYEQVNQIIQSFENLSFFKKLVIKRILVPPIFEQQMIESINILSDIIIKNNDNFIKKFFRNGLLFCQCDIYFWKKNIKLKYKYEETTLTEVGKIRFKKGERVNVLVIDDLQHEKDHSAANEKTQTTEKGSITDRRDQLLQELVSMEHENSIFFSHLPLNQDMNKHFKSIPFLLFLELYCFVNIDSHDKDTLLEERKSRHSVGRNSEMNEIIMREFGEGNNHGKEKEVNRGKERVGTQGQSQQRENSQRMQKSRVKERQNSERERESTEGKERQNSQRKSSKRERQITSQNDPRKSGQSQRSSSSHARISQFPSASQLPDSNYKILTNKQIKRHYYSLISQKSTEERSIAIIRFSNHIPILLKNQKNQSKILTYYYWKFLIWYQTEQKIVFESIKEKILKKNNELANKLEHYQQNKEILKAINILAPEKIRPINQEVLRIFKDYYAVLATYITKQPAIDVYESETQRNVFVNQSTSYEKNIQSMLNNIKDVSNILIGKTSLDPQRVSDYFDKKAMYSLTELNLNLLKLSKHRQQVNQQKTLTHLHIELIREPANIVALFSKPAYKIVLLGKYGVNDFGRNDLTKDEIPIANTSNKTISELLDLKEEEKPSNSEEDEGQAQTPKQPKVQEDKNEISQKQVTEASKKSMKQEKPMTKSKNELKQRAKYEKHKDPLRLKRPSDTKNQKSQTQQQQQRKSDKIHPLLKKSEPREMTGQRKLQKRLSFEVVPPTEQQAQNEGEGGKQKDMKDLFAVLFGKILTANMQQQQAESDNVQTPSSIANINTMKKRKNNKGITMHKIYIYNRYRILFKPIEKKQIDKLSMATMFRLKLFNGFDLKLFYQKEQAITNQHTSTYGSFSMASGGIVENELASKNNMSHQLMVKGDKQENLVEKKGTSAVSNKVLREMVPGGEVIPEEKSGVGESLIRIGSNADMEMGEESKDQLKSSLRRMSQGNVSRKGSEQEKMGYKPGGTDKFMSQLKDKKSLDHLKLKLPSNKKLQLTISSRHPVAVASMMDSLISNEGSENVDGDDDEMTEEQRNESKK